MNFIKNYSELINVSSESAKNRRKALLSLLDETLTYMNPKNLIEKSVKLRKNKLSINKITLDLTRYENIHVFGIGKACGFMAEALEELMIDKIFGGTIIVLEGTSKKYHLKKVSTLEGSHPIPSDLNVSSTGIFLKELEKVSKYDLVIFLISGGGSALLCMPEEGISLKDLQEMNEILLKSGLDILKINTMRKHVSKVKGGQLVRYMNEAMNVSFIISDVVGDPLGLIASGPTYPDKSTFKDCVKIMGDLKNLSMPESIYIHLKKGANGMVPETPKSLDLLFRKNYHEIIGNLTIACEFLQVGAGKINLSTKIYSRSLQGEAREVGATLFQEARSMRNDSKQSIFLIAGGETTVTVKGNGNGGRNSELILGALAEAKKHEKFTMASIGTDGSDNSKNFEIAGLIIDEESYKQVQAKGLDIIDFLSRNDSHTFFKELGKSFIVTGDTGTNFADIMLVMME